MTENNSGLSSQILNTLTGGLLNLFFESLRSKTETIPSVLKLKDKIKKDKIHPEAKKLLETCISLAYENIEISEYRIKAFIEFDGVRKLIINWILKDFSSQDTADLDAIPFEKFVIDEDEKKLIIYYLEQLFGLIKSKKVEFFSPENLNILHQLNRLEDIIRNQTSPLHSGQSEIKAEVHHNRLMVQQNFEKIEQELSQIKNDLSVPDLEGQTKSFYSFNEQLKEIKSDIDSGKIQTARSNITQLLKLYKQSGEQDDETKFLIYAYLSQTYLNTYTEQTEAIPYLEKAAEYCPDKERKYRNIALAYLLKGELEEGINAIDIALAENPKKPEAIFVKVDLLIKQGRKKEAEKTLNTLDLHEENSELLQNKSLLAFKRKKIDEAIQLAQKAIQLSSNTADPYMLHSEIVVTYLNDLLGHQGKLKKKHYSLLKAAKDHLAAALEILTEEQEDKLSIAFARRGLIYMWLFEFSSAKKDLVAALKYSEKNISILRKLVMTNIALKEYEDAKIHTKKLRALNENDPYINQFIGEAYLEMSEIDDAINFLEALVNSDDADNYLVEYLGLLIEAYDRNFETSKAGEKIESLIQQYGKSPQILFIKTKHLLTIGEFEKSLELANQIIEEAKGRLKINIRVLIADIHYARGTFDDFKKAAAYYKTLSDVQVIDKTIIRYAKSLYKSGQYNKCVQLCSNVQELHSFVREFCELEASIYTLFQNYLPASENYRELARRYPSNITYKVNLGICLFNIGKSISAKDVLQQAENFLDSSNSISGQELALLSQGYLHIESYKKAIKLAYKGLQKDINSPQLHRHYITLYLNVSNFISDIDEKYIECFQDSMKNFERRFPDEEHFFQKYEVSKDPKEMVSNLIEIMKPVEKQRQNIENLYFNKRLSLGFLAQGMGRDLVTTWGGVTSHPYLKVWFASGSKDEIDSELTILDKTVSVIIGPVALLTLNALNLLEKFSTQFKQIIVCQAVFDEFREFITNQKIFLNEGQMSVGTKDGELFREHLPPDAIQHSIDTIERITNFINKEGKVSIIGKSINREKKIDEEFLEVVPEVLGVALTESLFEIKS